MVLNWGGLSDDCDSKNHQPLPRQMLSFANQTRSARLDMGSDSWWDADSHSLIGFTNEDSGANKHLSNPTPVTQSTASAHSSLPSFHKSSSTTRLITFYAELFLWSLIVPQQTHRLVCGPTGSPGKERGLCHNILPGVRGNHWGAQHLRCWQTGWAGWAVLAHWTSHMISSWRPGPANAWMLVWLGQFPAGSCLNQLFFHTTTSLVSLCQRNKLK